MNPYINHYVLIILLAYQTCFFVNSLAYFNTFDSLIIWESLHVIFSGYACDSSVQHLNFCKSAHQIFHNFFKLSQVVNSSSFVWTIIKLFTPLLFLLTFPIKKKHNLIIPLPYRNYGDLMTVLYCSRFNVSLDKTVSEDSHDQLISVPIFTVFCKMYVYNRKSLFNSYIDGQFLAWAWLAKPKANVVIPKNQPLPKHLRKKRVKVRSTPATTLQKKKDPLK